MRTIILSILAASVLFFGLTFLVAQVFGGCGTSRDPWTPVECAEWAKICEEDEATCRKSTYQESCAAMRTCWDSYSENGCRK